jgi:hypothetical protein
MKKEYFLEGLEKLKNNLDSYNTVVNNQENFFSPEWVCQNLFGVSKEDVDMFDKKNIAKQRIDLLDGL